MDKQATLGFILISIILIGWLWFMTPHQPAVQPPPVDSVAKTERVTPDTTQVRLEQPAGQDSLGRFFAPRQRGIEKTIVIRTDHYTAEITTRGGLIRKWDLSQSLTWDKQPVQLVDYDAEGA